MPVRGGERHHVPLLFYKYITYFKMNIENKLVVNCFQVFIIFGL